MSHKSMLNYLEQSLKTMSHKSMLNYLEQSLKTQDECSVSKPDTQQITMWHCKIST